jgi:VWFA-related protein
MRRSCLCAVVALLLTAVPAAQRQTFRSSVQLIEVDVRVFGKDGRFVADLAKDDFEVLEHGVPQRIDAMYLVVGPPAAGGNGSTKPVDPATPAPPTTPVPGPAAAQTWIFMFDLNHLTPGGGFDRARKAVGDFIAHRFKEGDLAGIVAGEKMVNNRLTSVRQELVDAVTQVKPRNDARNRFIELTREWPRFLDEEEAVRAARYERDVVARVVARACAEQPESCGRGDAEAQVRAKGIRLQQEIHRATNQTLGALNALASGLARMAGPKTVVFLSDGFVVQDVETTLRTVVGQTARAGGRVYAIDVRGQNRGNTGDVGQMLADDPYTGVAKFDTGADGANSLAVDTGGMMIRNENNIGRALDRIADDAGQYYVLAYQPANAEFDGKFRPIEVRVKRPGVRVRARRGYLALEPAKMLVPQPIK